MANVFDRLLRTDARRLREVEKKVAPAEALADRYAAMSDDELKAETPRLKQKLADGA